MAGPIIAGKHVRLQAFFALVSVVVCFLFLAPEEFLHRVGWLGWIVNWVRHLFGLPPV